MVTRVEPEYLPVSVEPSVAEICGLRGIIGGEALKESLERRMTVHFYRFDSARKWSVFYYVSAIFCNWMDRMAVHILQLDGWVVAGLAGRRKVAPHGFGRVACMGG